MKFPALLLSILCAISTAAFAQKPAPKAANAGPLAAIEDQAGLPRVLLIGESISIGYTQPVRELLKDKANKFDSITNDADGTKDIRIVRHWWGAKSAGSLTLYKPDNYSWDGPENRRAHCPARHRRI